MPALTRAACALALGVVVTVTMPASAAPRYDSPGAAHYFAAKDATSHSPHGGPSYPDMTYHRGPVMPSATVRPIYWGTTWPTYVGDKITGLASFYQGYSHSIYAQRSGEYADKSGVKVGDTVSYQTEVIDPSPAPSGAPTVGDVLAEVAKVVPNPEPSGLGYYPVYVDTARPPSANFCAWHSYGNVNGVRVQIAFHFNLDGDTGCSNSELGTLHSPGLAALANVSAHELSEARSDPVLNAWYDRDGEENADKCAWTFGPTDSNPAQLSTLSNGTQWKLQGEWSNVAYDSGIGYPNAVGDKGCLAGF